MDMTSGVWRAAARDVGCDNARRRRDARPALARGQAFPPAHLHDSRRTNAARPRLWRAADAHPPGRKNSE